MTAKWWLDYVLPGFIDGIPLVIVSLAGMWLQHRKTRKSLTRLLGKRDG